MRENPEHQDRYEAAVFAWETFAMVYCFQFKWMREYQLPMPDRNRMVVVPHLNCEKGAANGTHFMMRCVCCFFFSSQGILCQSFLPPSDHPCE
ncbi:MAG: hypothetical protein ACK50J_01390 [Planctomyces sp.]